MGFYDVDISGGLTRWARLWGYTLEARYLDSVNVSAKYYLIKPVWGGQEDAQVQHHPHSGLQGVLREGHRSL